jgi:hypothetical protein
MSTITPTPLHERIYAALTENTGTHMLDSGGAYGRHWERNGRATIADMVNAPRATLSEWGVSLDTFHYLAEWCELADDHAACAMLATLADENPDESWFGIADMLRDAVRDADGWASDGWNTYNWETLLSQGLQGYCLTMPDDDRVMLVVQVHGGCDVRGGYTRPYLLSLGEHHGDGENAEACFCVGTTDAEVYCTRDECGYGFTIHGPDVFDRDGCYIAPAPEGTPEHDTYTAWLASVERSQCPECGGRDALRADMQDASYE